jgi:NAD(P)-dependent dehydrogenase (short-subunit alcohol dehydrogenase family)
MLEHSFMGRPGTPEELANAVLFVASEKASYISGQNYIVDGCRKKM